MKLIVIFCISALVTVSCNSVSSKAFTWSKEQDDLVDRGKFLMKQQNYTGAIEVFDQAIKMEATTDTAGYAWGYKGDSLQSLERYEEAVAAYNTSIELLSTPEWKPISEWKLLIHSWEGKGNTLLYLGKSDEGSYALRMADELNQTYILPIIENLKKHSSIGAKYYELAMDQREEGNTSEQLTGTYYLDITNASAELTPKIFPGTYDSTKYVIPVGPYEVSFQMRSPLNVFGVGYSIFNGTAGSGKTYHVNEYEQYILLMENYDFQNRQLNGYFSVWITHCTNSSKYPPLAPSRDMKGLRIASSWDFASDQAITIDGHQGYEQVWYTPNSNLGYIIEYDQTSSTFVTMQLHSLDWAKDGELALETFHISEKRA
jgi:hypothetical protein